MEKMRSVFKKYRETLINCTHLTTKLGTDVREESTNIIEQKNRNSIIRNPRKFKIRNTF